MSLVETSQPATTINNDNDSVAAPTVHHIVPENEGGVFVRIEQLEGGRVLVTTTMRTDELVPMDTVVVLAADDRMASAPVAAQLRQYIAPEHGILCDKHGDRLMVLLHYNGRLHTMLPPTRLSEVDPLAIQETFRGYCTRDCRARPCTAVVQTMNMLREEHHPRQKGARAYTLLLFCSGASAPDEVASAEVLIDYVGPRPGLPHFSAMFVLFSPPKKGAPMVDAIHHVCGGPGRGYVHCNFMCTENGETPPPRLFFRQRTVSDVCMLRVTDAATMRTLECRILGPQARPRIVTERHGTHAMPRPAHHYCHKYVCL